MAEQSLTGLISDVARPDRISGADINAICQEVTFPTIMSLSTLECSDNAGRGGKG